MKTIQKYINIPTSKPTLPQKNFFEKNTNKTTIINNFERIEELNLDSIQYTKATSNPLYEYDENKGIRLKQTHPELQKKIDELVEKCKEQGIEIKITETLRDVDRQNELYAKGRTEEGNIVTNAKGSDYSSIHQWGIAFDVCINIVGDEYNEEKLKKVGQIGKSIGLEWGGEWEFTDTPHFQLLGYSDINDLKNEYENPANFADTWER